MAGSETCSPTDVWAAALDELRLQMTRATFDTWVKTAIVISYQNGTFTIGASNGYARDWLEHRLHRVVQETLTRLVGSPVEVCYETVSDGGVVVPRVTPAQLAQPELPEIFVQGVREDDYARIVEPDKVFVGTQYFRREWLPRLGPVLWTLILELRQRCYWNKRTGEKRDQCKATYADLASAIGVSESTAYRTLNPKDTERRQLVDLFILDRQVLRHFSARLGREVNEAMLWRVRLDEPFTPEDEDASTCQIDG
jgi:hypothetical protein